MSNRAVSNGAPPREGALVDASGLSAREVRAGVPRGLVDLIRYAARFGGRHGYRVAAPGASGHIFFDGGRVIHAEYGEDCGLRAVNEMLRSGAIAIEPAVGSWPAQATLHLSPELLLSMSERDTSRVVRKVDLPPEPPPMPSPGSYEHEEHEALVAPVHASALRSSPSRRPVSGIVPKLVRAPASSASPAAVTPPGVMPSGVTPSGVTLQAASSSARPRSAPRSERPTSVVRAAEPRLRSTIAAQAAQAAAREPPSIAPVPPRAGGQPTTMVRITPHGELLAARGKNAEQVAEAAAFIHGLASAIAADFGRRARANVHLSGNGMSLLVARSEVNDIAAALGPTERVSSLLGKVGFK